MRRTGIRRGLGVAILLAAASASALVLVHFAPTAADTSTGPMLPLVEGDDVLVAARCALGAQCSTATGDASPEGPLRVEDPVSGAMIELARDSACSAESACVRRLDAGSTDWGPWIPLGVARGPYRAIQCAVIDQRFWVAFERTPQNGHSEVYLASVDRWPLGTTPPPPDPDPDGTGDDVVIGPNHPVIGVVRLDTRLTGPVMASFARDGDMGPIRLTFLFSADKLATMTYDPALRRFTDPVLSSIQPQALSPPYGKEEPPSRRSSFTRES